MRWRDGLLLHKFPLPGVGNNDDLSIRDDENIRVGVVDDKELLLLLTVLVFERTPLPLQIIPQMTRFSRREEPIHQLDLLFTWNWNTAAAKENH